MSWVNDYDAVCTDCLMMIANGDSSGIEDFDEWQSRVAEKNPTNGGVYYWSPVMSDTDDDLSYFGKAPCSYCGNHLAGDRHPVYIEI